MSRMLVMIIALMVAVHFAGGWLFAQLTLSDYPDTPQGRSRAECMSQRVYRNFLWERFLIDYVANTPTKQGAVYAASFSCASLARSGN